MLYDVISSALQNTPCTFPPFSKSAACKLARHESSTQDECLAFKTSASFSSAIESHRSCITSVLLAPPEGNSHLSGEIAKCLQVNGEITDVYTFIPPASTSPDGFTVGFQNESQLYENSVKET